MESGLVGLDGLNTSKAFSSENAAESKTNNLYGSGFLKQERPCGAISEEDCRELKMAKTDAMLLHNKVPLLRSESQQMLSFSSPNSQTATLHYYHQPYRTTGYGSGGLNASGMQGVLSGAKGPLTPSQWMELEHQALIYKYITASMPIPSYLLNPIRKAFESAGFSTFSGLRSNAFGWGAFHLGFPNTDPEPGRCRRTDGKKWRCSRDAVADQKYCERHMNRGRHRSRKPVEGQPGHSVSGTMTTTAKLPPLASSTSNSLVAGADASNSLGFSHHHQRHNLQHGSHSTLSATSHINCFLGKDNVDAGYQNSAGFSVISPNMGQKDNHYSVAEQQNAYLESSQFGLVCSDSLLNPLNKSSSLGSCRNYNTSSKLSDHESKTDHQIRQFMDNWPKHQSERAAISWPDADLQPDRTQLSISIPLVTSDFMSSTSSPMNDKLSSSPLRLCNELEATQMGLGIGSIVNELSHKQAHWIPISWEPSMGGPLGEVLHSTNNSTTDSKNSLILNLMKDGWETSSHFASSPTGVLQKGAFGSLSSSSAGSSPRAESSKTLDGSSICNGYIASGLMHPSLPAV